MKKMSIFLAALLVFSMIPAAAFAQEAPDQAEAGSERILENLKERAVHAIEKRLDTIERVTEALVDAEHLTDEHERRLLDELSLSAIGLTELSREIEATETIAEIWELIPKIFEDYRIYVVMVPKAHLVVVADSIAAVGDRVELVEGSLEDAIDRLKEAGFDTSEAEEALAVMTESLRQAGVLAGAVPDTVLTVEPSDWPDPAQGILEGAHSDLRSARSQIESAIRSAHEVGRILRDLLAGT